MDVHIPQAVTEQLRRRNVDVLTAIEDSAAQFEDEAMLIRATELQRLLVTQDIRFCTRAETWQAMGRHFAGLAFAHQLSITIGQFVTDLELIATASGDEECDDQIFRLPLQR